MPVLKIRFNIRKSAVGTECTFGNEFIQQFKEYFSQQSNGRISDPWRNLMYGYTYVFQYYTTQVCLYIRCPKSVFYDQDHIY